MFSGIVQNQTEFKLPQSCRKLTKMHRNMFLVTNRCVFLIRQMAFPNESHRLFTFLAVGYAISLECKDS